MFSQCSQLREEVATLRDKLSLQVEEQSQMESTIAQLKDKLHQAEVSHSSTKGEVCIVLSGYIVNASVKCFSD